MLLCNAAGQRACATFAIGGRRYVTNTLQDRRKALSYRLSHCKTQKGGTVLLSTTTQGTVRRCCTTDTLQDTAAVLPLHYCIV